MDVQVRPRLPEDFATLAAVLVQVHERDGYPVEGVADPRSWLTPPREVAAWTALDDSVAIGQISLTQADSDDDAAKLWMRHTRGHLSQLVIPVRLFVDPEHRQRGAGSALLLAARTYAIEHDLAIAFDVMLKDADAIRLYEAIGCVRLGTIEHVHGDGKIEPAAVYVAPTHT